MVALNFDAEVTETDYCLGSVAVEPIARRRTAPHRQERSQERYCSNRRHGRRRGNVPQSKSGRRARRRSVAA